MIQRNSKNLRMRRLLTVLALCLFSVNTFAQAPDKTSSQTTVKDENGRLVTNKETAVPVDVVKDTQEGPAVVVEDPKTATNANGLASLDVGQDSKVQEPVAVIELANGPSLINTATDRIVVANYQIVGLSEPLPVSALMPRKSERVGEERNDLPEGLLNISGPTKYKESATGWLKDAGVPSQVWSLFGNSKTDPSKDKLGTTDFKDLVIVTNNIDRLRISAGGDINIARSLNVGNDLRVNRNVDLNILGGATVNNGNFTVKNASSTLLTGTLTVDRATVLQSTLDVKNAAATHLTGTLDVDLSLNVDGATTLQNTLQVKNGAATNLTGTLDVDQSLNVDGATNLQSTLQVKNGAATTLTGTLNVGGATSLKSLNANGQVTINTSVAGGDQSYGAYPLRVEGSGQGIAIKLSAGTPNNSNDFVTFFNSSGSTVGRIEGETSGEATTSPEFIFENSILVAEEVTAVANVVLAAIPVVVGGLGVSSGPCGACLAITAADLILASANLAAYNIFALQNLGVTYESGSADYAEWLERNDPNEKISAGDIVGVNGGKISKYTLNSKQYMVISTKPAMLGNMPPGGQEELHEKVAFMGQIPVKVRGIVLSGDYILPSGLNDGIGVAVSPDVIAAEQYREIVGVAWSSSFIDDGISAVNMAIGLNANDVANLAVQQEKRIKDLENKFSSLEQRFLALETGTVNPPNTVAPNVSSLEKQTPPKKEMTRSETLAAYMPPELSDEVMEDAIRHLKNEYTTHGISFKDHPGLNKLFTDATYRAEVIKKAQERYRISYQKSLRGSKK